MEFAVEAQSTAAPSASKGRWADAAHRATSRASIAGKTILERARPRHRRRRGARHHGAERLRQEHPGERARRTRRLRRHAGRSTFDGVDLLALAPEDRAARGLFLAFQYPVEIPGVGNIYFLRSASTRCARSAGCRSSTPWTSSRVAKEHMAATRDGPGVPQSLGERGFSGGEKKRNEILQMAMLEPRLAILDETDSGLDIDALRIVAQGVERAAQSRPLDADHHPLPAPARRRRPDYVHVLSGGRIVRSGDHHLAAELEANGYTSTLAAVPA